MRCRALLVAGIALAGSFGPPAHADLTTDSWVTTSYQPTAVPLDAGHEVVVLCDASAGSADQTAIPLATSVACSVNGQGASRAMPGREAYVVVFATVDTTYTVCISGQSSIADPVSSQTGFVSTGPACTTEYV